MKIGDIVTITDGSFSIGTSDGQLKHIHGCEMHGRRYRVLSVGGSFPTHGSYPPNNTMVVDVKDPTQIVFIQEDQCCAVAPPKGNSTAVIPVPAGTKKVVLIFK